MGLLCRLVSEERRRGKVEVDGIVSNELTIIDLSIWFSWLKIKQRLHMKRLYINWNMHARQLV